MLEFTYRYVTDILDEAKAYSNHANKKTVDCDDVALAVHSKMDNAFTTPPPRELLLELARTKNSQPLPLIKQGIGKCAKFSHGFNFFSPPPLPRGFAV